MNRTASFVGLCSIAVIASLLLGGCSADEPGAGSTPSPTQTKTPLPTPPTRTPDPGELIREVKTVKEFIHLWDQAETRMLNTGDTAEYLAISKGCVPCEKTAKQVERFYSRGGYVKTKGSRIVSIKRAGTWDGHRVFQLREFAEPTEYRASKNAPVKRLTGGTVGTKVAIVNEQFGGWLIVEAFNVPVES